MNTGYINIDVSQFEEYQLNLLRAQNQFDSFVKAYLNKIAGMIMAKALMRSPVDTGTLRRSWKVSKVETKGSITQITVYNDARQDGMNVSYASYVEMGHYSRNRVSYIEGVWMLTKSTNELKAEIYTLWNQGFEAWAKRMGL